MSSQQIDTSNNKKESNPRLVGRYVLAYFLLLIFILLAAFILFRVRINIVQIAFVAGYNQVKVKGIANMGVLITGIILLSGIVVSEDYLRNGVEKKELWKRALRIFFVEATIIAFLLALYYIIFLIVV